MRVSGVQSPRCRRQGTVVSVIIVFVLIFFVFVLVFINENRTVSAARFIQRRCLCLQRRRHEGYFLTSRCFTARPLRRRWATTCRPWARSVDRRRPSAARARPGRRPGRRTRPLDDAGGRSASRSRSSARRRFRTGRRARCVGQSRTTSTSDDTS